MSSASPPLPRDPAPREPAPRDPAPRRPAPPALGTYDCPRLFYALALGIPWGLWILAGALSRAEPRSAVLDVLTATTGVAGLLAPVLIAAVLISRRRGLVRDVGHRLVNLREVPGWAVLLAVGLLPAALVAATALSVLMGGSTEQFQLRGGFSFTSGLLPAWFILAAAPLLEELAWHSYGTDALVARWSVLRASLVFAAFWALWHLPLGGIRGYYQAEVVEQGALASINFLVSTIPFMILMNWLYYRSARCIWVPVLVHLAANFGNEVLRTEPGTKALQTALLLLVAGWVLWRERELFLLAPANRSTLATP